MRLDEGSMRLDDWQDIRLLSPPPPEAPGRPDGGAAEDDDESGERGDSPAATTTVAELERALQHLRLRRHFCKDQIEQLSANSLLLDSPGGSPGGRQAAHGRTNGGPSGGGSGASDASDSSERGAMSPTPSGRESTLSEGDADEEGYVPFTM